MEPRLILHFRNSSKSGQTAEFPASRFTTIQLGRETGCEVAFDAETDDLVSRRHAQIKLDAPGVYTLADGGSRNGTYVNRQRIGQPVKLQPGDVIQLGPGGPEMTVELEPRPAKATRLAAAEATTPAPVHQPTRQADAEPKAALGKLTVERMIADGQRRTAKKSVQIGLGIAAAVVLFGGTLALPSVREKVFGTRLSAAEVAKATSDAVVYFEAGWKLVDTESGRSLYQLYIPNKIAEPAPAPAPAPVTPQTPGDAAPTEAQRFVQQQPVGGAPAPAPGQTGQPEQRFREIVPGGPPMLPAFIQLDNGLEPILTTEAGEGGNKPVGGRHMGSGFVVSNDGFILTNRHVAASWMARYDFNSPVGIVIQTDAQGNKKMTPIGPQQFPNWMPSRARFILRGQFDPNGPLTGVAAGGKTVEGRNDYLDVTFARNRERVQAKLVRTSDQADVALVKIDLPRKLRTLELLDNYETITQGDEIAVMGYPGVSPMLIGTVQSKEAITPTLEQRVIPDPTLSVGNIGRVIRGKAGLTEATYSAFGDTYQLTVNSTGGGNSGGPVVDARGRVIGLFTYAIQTDARITFAVPIRYGMELMGTKPVI